MEALVPPETGLIFKKSIHQNKLNFTLTKSILIAKTFCLHDMDRLVDLLCVYLVSDIERGRSGRFWLRWMSPDPLSCLLRSFPVGPHYDNLDRSS